MRSAMPLVNPRMMGRGMNLIADPKPVSPIRTSMVPAIMVHMKRPSTPYLATIPAITTSLNGHMFTYLNPTGALALRLPKDEREKFLKKYKTTLFEAYGAVMKEYVTVPDGLLRNTKELRKYFELSCEYVGSLKPKPSKTKA